MGMFVLKWAQERIAQAWSSDAKNARIWIPGLLFLFVSVGSFCRTRDTGAASFSIDLDKPFNEVLAIVDEVARSGSIKGTFEYRGDEQLGGAQFAEKSSLFAAWTEPGKVFYKIRTKALSPSHFLNSNDVGTVAVRYVVQERGPNSTRLFIDAVYIENARHHGHPSDGYVETCEFGEIGKLLKDREQLQKLAASGQPLSPGQESSSLSPERQEEIRAEAQKSAKPANSSPKAPKTKNTKPKDASPSGLPKVAEVDSAKLADLQRAIAEQKSLLAADHAALDRLEAQARQMRASEFVRVKSDRAELKVLPYSHAHVVEALKKGQEVTVLAKSAHWYQVRSEDGQEGWISHAVLEVQP
jgi:hypothetical protein